MLCSYVIVVLIQLTCLIHLGKSYEYEHAYTENELFSSSFELNDWNSNLYGKPICINIPSNMSLCSNMNYRKMKVPNLLGHESLDEVLDCLAFYFSLNNFSLLKLNFRLKKSNTTSKIEYQSSVWIPLLSINCHRDTQLFLCSLFAPVCVEQTQAIIYPCRSLCESVKLSCEGSMLSYNYPWPSMFNCSRFPKDNGLCIQLSNQMISGNDLLSNEKNSLVGQHREQSEVFSSPATVSSSKAPKNKPKTRPNKNNNNNNNNNLGETSQTCHGCRTNENMEAIVKSYCNSNIGNPSPIKFQ
jgi:hypothetical protein